jgi:DNA topoisomerase VI subunit A
MVSNTYGSCHFDYQESRKSAITLRVMHLLHAVLSKRIHITKRDLFYTDVKLFVDQTDSDAVLDDVATMIGCTRSNLHVVASDKGLVVGRIQFEEDGDPIDCTRMGVGGKAIPPYVDKIENIRSDAEFVLLVEKEAAYMRLAVSIKCCFGHYTTSARYLMKLTTCCSLLSVDRRIGSTISIHVL